MSLIEVNAIKEKYQQQYIEGATENQATVSNNNSNSNSNNNNNNKFNGPLIYIL